jgi:tetratricopeptide (TPR) repeat protein
MPVSRPIRLMLLAAAVAVVLVQPALAQNSARIFGVVTDHEGNPVDGAAVLMEFQGGLTRSFQTSSNAQGEYIQVGLASGPYLVTYTAEGIGMLRYNLRLSAGQEFELDVQVLGQGQIDRTGLSAEEIADLDAREATADAFTGGLEAARGGNYDEAAQLLAEAIEVTPDCGECLRNLGIVEFQRGNYDEAEQALRRATEIAPDDAAAFDALADVYNTQRRFDEAGEASAEATRLSGGAAGGGGDAGAVFDQGLIAWNAGRLADARGRFEQTLELDPSHGEAHYWLGMANLNAGQMAEAVASWRIYVEREPNGRFAAQANALIAQLAP